MIYLDNAASTAVHNDVVEEMIPYFATNFGNPSSIHKLGRKANKAIQKARKQVAELINAEPNEIFFTSGGTESNNTALNGFPITKEKNHIITSMIEHDAILEPCKKLKQDGFFITYLPVDEYGQIDVGLLKNSITEKTILVSIMFANNEVGTIQKIQEISDICKTNHVLFHTDAVQAIGKFPIDVKKFGIDLLSISSHKINGPKGVGALFVRNGLKLNSLIYGGGQENGLRSGTENVASIVGFGKACEIAKNSLLSNMQHFYTLHKLLVDKITSEIPYVTLNGHSTQRIFNNVHLTFLGINGEDLIIKLDENGIEASTGSACSVHAQKASHVLQAMGFSHEQISGSLRLTFGYNNTFDEVNEIVAVVKKVVTELRNFSPYKAKYNF